MSENITPPPRNLDQESESEFLQHEAQQARQAIERSLEELKASLHTAADLRLWAQHHPWLTVGAASAAGFAAGAAITSAARGSPPTAAAAASPTSGNGHFAAGQSAFTGGQSAPPQPQPSALWTALMGPMFDLAKFAIQSAIAAAMGGVMQAQAQEQAHPERAEATPETPTEFV